MYWLYRRRDFLEHHRVYKKKVENLEVETKVVTPTTQLGAGQPITQELTWMFQATQYIGCGDEGRAKVYATSTTSTVDEETNAACIAMGTFDDVGGNGAASASGETGTVDVPMYDGKSAGCNYHGNPTYLAWESVEHPTVAHTKLFMSGHAWRCNHPGTVANDTHGLIWYSAASGFNVSSSISFAIWFYPTDISAIGGETLRPLIYRYIDASNLYGVYIKPADSKMYAFVKEAGADSKIATSGTVQVNQWNLVIVTYNPSTNALTIYLNNSSASSTPADAVPVPYTSSTSLFLGGLYTQAARRFTGYLDHFLFWTGKILTSGEASNLWNHGTIV